MTYTLKMMRRDSQRAIAGRTRRGWRMLHAALSEFFSRRVLGNSVISALLAVGIAAVLIHSQYTA